MTDLTPRQPSTWRVQLWARQAAPRLASVAVVIALWQLLAWVGWINTQILPAPWQLAATAWEMTRSGELPVHVLDSTRRVLVGFLLAAAVGLTLGLALGAGRRLDRYLHPLVELLRPIPPIAWIPLAILWFGIGDQPAYFIVTLGAFFPIFVNSYHGIRQVHPLYIRAAQCLGATRRLLITDVLLPAALPAILTGLRVGIGVAWTSVIAAELVGAQSGLGYMIQTNRILLRTDKIVVGMLAIGVVGLLINQSLGVLERRWRWLAWQQSGADRG